MIYLTVNDSPSGVYKSQVIDVMEELNQHSPEAVKLVSLIPWRNYSRNKSQIREWNPSARVVRMIPGLSNWRKNRILLLGIKRIKKEGILARGPMAFALAKSVNKNVSYDGRGAVKAELEEFPDMIPDKKIVAEIIRAEENAVKFSKHRIAVSSKLVDYWADEYAYNRSDHQIIPCTLSHSVKVNPTLNSKILAHYGWSKEDIILVYSGSIARWQSFDALKVFLESWIEEQGVKVLFLSKESSQINELMKRFPRHVKREWVKHDDVWNYLNIGDYGILIRDQNITNRVASPVKFAEYLSVGLRILISPNLGDYSHYVEKNGLGHVVSTVEIELRKTNLKEKDQAKNVAFKEFTKEANRNKFIDLLTKIDK